MSSMKLSTYINNMHDDKSSDEMNAQDLSSNIQYQNRQHFSEILPKRLNTIIRPQKRYISVISEKQSKNQILK